MRSIYKQVVTYLNSLYFWRKKTTPFVYVALGDSSVEGVGASSPTRTVAHIISRFLQHVKKDVRVYNLGKSGAKIHDVLTNQIEKAIRLQPDLITLSVGTNDILQRTKMSHFVSDLHVILQKLRQETHAEIVINNVPDFSLTPAVPIFLKVISKFFIRRVNAVLQREVKRYEIVLVDVNLQSKLYSKHYPESISSDKFHPSDFGYALWANTIIAHLQKRLK